MQNTLKILKALEKYPVFSSGTFRGITGESRVYSNLHIHRLKKAGLIFEIERGKYTTHKNAFLIASRIVWPSYISLLSALRFYNLTEQIPQGISVVTTKRRGKPAVEFCGTKILFNQINKKYFLGFKKEIYEGFEIFIAEPEKAIADGLLLGKISEGEISEIIEKNRNELDFRKLEKFALQTKNSELVKKIVKILKENKISASNKMIVIK